MKRRLKQRLFRLTPLSQVPPNNPLYRLETGRFRWATNDSALINISLRWAGLATAVVVLLWLGILVYSVLRLRVIDQREIASASLVVAFVAALISGALSLALNSVALQSALSCFQREFLSGRWILLRATPMREGHLILAKHAAAQVRSWRLTMWIVGLRLGALLIALVATLLEIASVEAVENRFTMLYGYTSGGYLGWPVYLALALAGAALLLVVILAEPVHRLRALTAIGLAISASDRSGASAGLLAAAVIGGLLLIELAALLIFFYGILASGMIFLFVSGLDVLNVTNVWLLLGTGVYLLFSLGAFNLVQAGALRQTARRLAAREE